MFRLTHRLPNKYYVACSGGVDSLSVLHWLSRAHDNTRLLGAIYIHHNTGEFADRSKEIVYNFCKPNNITFLSYNMDGIPPSGTSKEGWWRDERYKLLSNVPGRDPILIAHQLDDCVEEYLMCVIIRGYIGTIPYSHGRCIRPFRKWKRQDILHYAQVNKLVWAEDPSNINVRHKRNFIRHNIIPNVHQLNPGIYKIVEKLIDKQDKLYNLEERLKNGHV